MIFKTSKVIIGKLELLNTTQYCDMHSYEYNGYVVITDSSSDYVGYDLGEQYNGLYYNITCSMGNIIINKSIHGGWNFHDGVLINYHQQGNIDPLTIEIKLNCNTGEITNTTYSMKTLSLTNTEAFNQFKEQLSTNIETLVMNHSIDTVYNSIGVNSACLQVLHSFRNRVTGEVVSDGIYGLYGDIFTETTSYDLHKTMKSFDDPYNIKESYYHIPNETKQDLYDTRCVTNNGFNVYTPYADIRLLEIIRGNNHDERCKNILTNRFKKAILLKSGYLYNRNQTSTAFELQAGEVYDPDKMINNKYNSDAIQNI